MRRYLLLGLVVTGSLLATVGGRLYYTHHYLPVRAVQPIVKLLDAGNSNSIEQGTYLCRGLKVVRYSDGSNGMERDPNRIRIMGGGAEEVKSALLRAMARATDPVSLDFLLFCVVASREEGTIKFQGEKEWGIIAAAAERQSKNPWQNVQFFVMKDENGMPLLNLGAVRGTP